MEKRMGDPLEEGFYSCKTAAQTPKTTANSETVVVAAALSLSSVLSWVAEGVGLAVCTAGVADTAAAVSDSIKTWGSYV